MGEITALEVQKRNKKRVNIYIDEAYAFSLGLNEAARLHKGQQLSDDEIEALREQDSVTWATDVAARFLSYRPRSIAEVRQHLAQKETADLVIDAAIDRLINLGYLDDHAFAAFWVQSRNASKPLSPRALRYELRQKGVANAIIDEVLADLDAADSALRAAEIQARRLRGSTRRTFRDKLNGVLLRRGFSYGTVRDTIRQLMETLENDDPDFFADDTNPQDHDSDENQPYDD